MASCGSLVLVLAAVLNTNVYGLWVWLGHTARTTTPAIRMANFKDTSPWQGRSMVEPGVMYGYHSKKLFTTSTTKPYLEEPNKERKEIGSMYDQFASL